MKERRNCAKLILLVVFCGFSIGAIASNKTYTNRYYNYVNQAHVEMCKGNMELSSIKFDSAFKHIQPFFTDLNNAIYTHINSVTPDQDRVCNYLQLMQQKGLCIHKYYENIDRYQPYLKLVDCAKCNQVVDLGLSKKLNEATAFDQVLRIFSIDTFGNAYDTRMLPALDKVDSVNYLLVDSILNLSLERNISIEELVGYNSSIDAWIILLHNGPWSRYNKELLDTMVVEGLIDNREISFLYDNHCSGNYARKFYSNWGVKFRCEIDYAIFGTRLFNQLNERIYISGVEDIKRNSISEVRKRYYLPDVIEEAKIKAYIAFRFEDGLRYPGMTLISYEGAEEEFEKNYLGYPYIRYQDRKDYDFKREFTLGK